MCRLCVLLAQRMHSIVQLLLVSFVINFVSLLRKIVFVERESARARAKCRMRYEQLLNCDRNVNNRYVDLRVKFGRNMHKHLAPLVEPVITAGLGFDINLCK